MLEPVTPWLRRAFLRGLDESVADGSLSATPAGSWRAKIRGAGHPT